MVTDGSLIRKARQAAFTLIVKDPELNERSNQRMKETFIKDYSQYLDSINLS